MTETQNELLKLFCEIDDICKRHDIVYYMAGGTLIGVLRHKGFIPWDDDLDIMMPRNEWLRFVEACKTELPPDRILEGQEINRDYTNTFGRYTDTSVTAIHKTELLTDASAGFVIDVFPLDPVPDQEAFEQYTKDMLLYSDIINPQGLYSYRYGVNKDRYFETLADVEKRGKDAVLSELEEKMFTYDEDECDYCVLRWGGVPFLFEKSMYGHSRWGEFEGRKCRMPDKASDYLVRHFGDEWTTIPPHEEQMEHDAIFSLDIDYRTFQEDYLSLVDLKDTKQKWLDRKEHIFNVMDVHLQMSRNKALAKAELRRMELERELEPSGREVQEMLDRRDYRALSELFKDYYDGQLERGMIGREDFGGMKRFVDPAFIDIPDHYLYAAVITLINTNRISKAHRLLEVRKQIKGALSDELQDAGELITRFRAIISDYDAGKVGQSLEKAEKLYSENPEMMSLEMFLCRTYIETEDFENAKGILNKCIEKYPEEGFFKKYMGDYYRNKGDILHATDLYKEAENTTENGIALLEIREVMEKINEQHAR